MKVSRLLMSLLIVGILLSVSVTPARADTPMPQALNGEEPDLGNSTLIPDDYVPPEDLILADATAPYPISPTGSRFIYNRTPKLYFARNELATAYKIYMYDARLTTTLLYTYIGGTENCGTSYCWLKPPTKLKTLRYDEPNGGYHAWRVSAKINGSWVHNTSYGYFYVLSKGFTSTFDVNTKGWEVINGTWKRTTTGLYKTIGDPYTNVNAWNKEYFTDNGIVIEARMKRKVETDSGSTIYFLGYPYSLWSSDHWQDGYSLRYFNEGAWYLYKSVGEDEIYLMGGTTSYVEPLNWNTFKIWVYEGVIYIWINGIYVGGKNDISLIYGAVGLAMYEGNPDLSPLFVDYVKVYYSSVWPDVIPPQGDIITQEPDFKLSPGGDTIIQ